jgi:hypothetical protein
MSRCIRTALDVSATQFGVNGVAANASTNSNLVSIDGCNQLLVEVTLVNTTAAATTISFFPEVRRHGVTAWSQLTTSSIAAGVETLSVRQIVCPTTAAAATTYSYTYPLVLAGMDAEEFRLRDITSAGGGAADLISINLRVGHGG